MSSKNIPSPARSQGATTKATSPTRRKSRRTRSVSSVTSNTSLRLTAVIRDSFPTSPITNRLSVLNDDTDIEIPGGQNWWRRLGDNSKRVSQLMDKNENESGSKVINFAEEIDIEILSQEKENMSVHLPESSDGESIQSIVIPQRKLFNHPEKKIKKIIYRKEILGKTQKSYFDHTEIDKDINVMPKKLFNQGRNPKTKPVFTASLLGESANKTSIEKPEQEVQGQVHNLFGNRANTKRKNIYAEFLLSDSDEEISEIQPKVFQFQRTDHEPMTKQKRRSASQSSVHSSASILTDLTDVSEWQHLPSSTMVEHQFEEATPSKWLSRLSRSRKSEIALNKNNSLNQSKRSNRSDSKIAALEAEKVNIINTRSQTLEKSKNTSNVITNKNESVRETPRKNSSKIMHNISMDETLTKVNMHVDLVNEGHEKTLTEENQHNDEEIFDVNATMVEHQFEEDGEVISSNRLNRLSRSRQSEFALSKNNSLNQSKRSNRSNSKIVPQEAEKVDIINTRSQTLDKSKNTSNVMTNKNESLHENISKIMHDKTLTEQVDLVNERREKTLTEENQHNDEFDEENFALFDVNAKNYEANQDISENIEKQRANIEIDSNEIVSNLNKTNEISKDKNLSKSPEAVLHDKTNRGESFTPHDGHTSMSKSKTSKTMIKELNIRPSLAPARESSGFTDGTIDSSAQNSGWDSHRTTRKTLRLTYGKDFTPSKSLRTLVMEKSAKRQTNFNQNDQASGLVDKSKHQESFHKVANQSKDKSIHQASSNEDPNQSKQQHYFDANAIPSEQEIEQNEEVKSGGTLEQNEESGSEQNEEVVPDETLKQNEESRSEQKEVVEPDEPLKQNGESVLEQNEESGSEQNEEIEPDETLKQNEESELEQNEEVEPDETLEKNEDSGSEQNEEVEPDGTLEHNEEPESDHNETLEHTEEVESDGTLKQNEEPASEQNEKSGLNINEEIEPDGTLEQNEESGMDQIEEIEPDRTLEQNEESGLDLNEEIEPDGTLERNEESGMDQIEEIEPDRTVEQNEESESEKELEQNEEFELHREPESMEVEEAVEESDNEASKRNFKNYLEKLKQENAEIRRRVHEKVLNSLKRPQPSFSAFKMPEVPKQKRSTKTIKKPAKPKLKSTMFTNLDHMPPQFFEDLKYKPPKRFTGRNAPWITKRLYKYLEDKLQQKYGCHARVRAEKLVEKLYVFAKEARKCERAAPPHRVHELKLEMARLAVVTTHHEFYRFFHEFMPREIRIRVNPDIMNKIPLPRNVFGNIIEEEED